MPTVGLLSTVTLLKLPVQQTSPAIKCRGSEYMAVKLQDSAQIGDQPDESGAYSGVCF